MTTQIIRHDRGLDAKRIEKLIDMIEGKINDILYDRRDVLAQRKEELKQEFIVQNNLQPHFNAIKDIDQQIRELEKQIRHLENQKEPHKIAISKLFRGCEDTFQYQRISEGSPADEYIKSRIFQYQRISEGSPADEYIKSRILNIDEIKNELKQLKEEMEEKLWLAKDIDEARSLYYYATSRIQELTGGI